MIASYCVPSSWCKFWELVFVPSLEQRLQSHGEGPTLGRHILTENELDWCITASDWVWLCIDGWLDYAHSNWQERVYPYTLSCLKNGGRPGLNLVWRYTWTLSPFFRQERVYLAYYILGSLLRMHARASLLRIRVYCACSSSLACF